MGHRRPTFSDLDMQGARRVTRRERFLALLDSMVPWDARRARVEPLYPRAGA